MDLQRLKELEKLAGLRFEPQEQEALLAQLIQLEKFAAALPEIPVGDLLASVPAEKRPSCTAPLSMDRQLEKSNAPLLHDGFYQIPNPLGESS